jgi:hypothetical protein
MKSVTHFLFISTLLCVMTMPIVWATNCKEGEKDCKCTYNYYEGGKKDGSFLAQEYQKDMKKLLDLHRRLTVYTPIPELDKDASICVIRKGYSDSGADDGKEKSGTGLLAMLSGSGPEILTEQLECRRLMVESDDVYKLAQSYLGDVVPRLVKDNKNSVSNYCTQLYGTGLNELPVDSKEGLNVAIDFCKCRDQVLKVDRQTDKQRCMELRDHYQDERSDFFTFASSQLAKVSDLSWMALGLYKGLTALLPADDLTKLIQSSKCKDQNLLFQEHTLLGAGESVGSTKSKEKLEKYLNSPELTTLQEKSERSEDYASLFERKDELVNKLNNDFKQICESRQKLVKFRARFDAAAIGSKHLSICTTHTFRREFNAFLNPRERTEKQNNRYKEHHIESFSGDLVRPYSDTFYCEDLRYQLSLIRHNRARLKNRTSTLPDTCLENVASNFGYWTRDSLTDFIDYKDGYGCSIEQPKQLKQPKQANDDDITVTGKNASGDKEVGHDIYTPSPQGVRVIVPRRSKNKVYIDPIGPPMPTPAPKPKPKSKPPVPSEKQGGDVKPTIKPKSEVTQEVSPSGINQGQPGRRVSEGVNPVAQNRAAGRDGGPVNSGYNNPWNNRGAITSRSQRPSADRDDSRELASAGSQKDSSVAAGSRLGGSEDGAIAEQLAKLQAEMALLRAEQQQDDDGASAVEDSGKVNPRVSELEREVESLKGELHRQVVADQTTRNQDRREGSAVTPSRLSTGGSAGKTAVATGPSRYSGGFGESSFGPLPKESAFTPSGDGASSGGASQLATGSRQQVAGGGQGAIARGGARRIIANDKRGRISLVRSVVGNNQAMDMGDFGLKLQQDPAAFFAETGGQVVVQDEENGRPVYRVMQFAVEDGVARILAASIKTVDAEQVVDADGAVLTGDNLEVTPQLEQQLLDGLAEESGRMPSSVVAAEEARKFHLDVKSHLEDALEGEE